MTEEEEVGDCLGQGTAGAGLISAGNLDIGLQMYFNKDETDDEDAKEDVTMFGDVRIQPIAYQDDIGSICDDVKIAKSQADKLTKMTLKKNLEAHPDKSGILIIGSDKYKQKVEKELSKNPIYLTNFKLDVKHAERYLEQTI